MEYLVIESKNQCNVKSPNRRGTSRVMGGTKFKCNHEGIEQCPFINLKKNDKIKNSMSKVFGRLGNVVGRF